MINGTVGKRLFNLECFMNFSRFFSFLVFSLVAASFVFVKCALYGGCLVSFFTGRLGENSS